MSRWSAGRFDKQLTVVIVANCHGTGSTERTSTIHAFRQLFLSGPLAQLTGQIHLISANSWLLILSCQTCMSPECFVSFFKPCWNERGVQSRTLPANLDFILRDLQFLSRLLENPNFCLERIKFIFGFWLTYSIDLLV